MTTAQEAMRSCYELRDRAARDWKDAGGSIVGYLCDHVPVELIIAAGLLPYRLSADPTSGSSNLKQYVEPFVQQPLATPGYVASMEHRVLNGDFDFVDYLVIPNGRKSIQAFYRDFVAAKAAYPELELPELHYLDKAMTPYFAASVFDRRQVFHFREILEQWSGKPIDDESLRSAISAENERRRLMSELAAARIAVPSRVSGVTALQIIGASMFMPRSVHNEILREFLADASSAESRPGLRVFVGGSPLDDDVLYRIIEANGATVVAEDHCWGGRCAELLVDETGDPFEALAERYHAKSACSIRFPISETTAQCVRRANEGAPDAAIFLVYSADSSQNWQVPDQINALEKAGVPVLYLADQPYGSGFDEKKHAVQTFLGSLTRQSTGAERLG
jgi:benzoyl-CoA reductase/2-hydroxyglutaryl-CoA dehydratase subunit BcrC/BadD/HgdB